MEQTGITQQSKKEEISSDNDNPTTWNNKSIWRPRVCTSLHHVLNEIITTFTDCKKRFFIEWRIRDMIEGELFLPKSCQRKKFEVVLTNRELIKMSRSISTYCITNHHLMLLTKIKIKSTTWYMKQLYHHHPLLHSIDILRCLACLKTIHEMIILPLSIYVHIHPCMSLNWCIL